MVLVYFRFGSVFPIWCVYHGVYTMVLVLTCFCLPPVDWCGLLRIFPLCLCGSGVFVVSGGCVTTAIFWIVALWMPYRSLSGGVNV